MSPTPSTPANGAHRRRVATSDGLLLSVYTRGDPNAPTVLCVHGYPDNATVWDGVAAHLSDRYHVVSYDVRGAGSSTAPRRRRGYDMELLTDDLVRVADAVSPDRPLHLLAHDWGSLQAWHAVTEPTHAERFSSYTSVSGPCLDHLAHWTRSNLSPHPAKLGKALNQALRSGYIGFFHTPVLPELAWLTGVGTLGLSGLERLVEGSPSRDAHRSRRGIRDYLNGLNLYRANIGNRMRHPEERRTSVPVQVLVPSGEVFMSEEAQAAASAWVPDLRLHRLSGGHWMPRTRPGAVAERVTNLVTETEAGHAPRNNALPGTRAFAGQLAVVTGAGSGIGRHTAFELAEQGARIVAVDVDAQAAARTADLAGLLGPGGYHYQLDVSDSSAMETFADWVRSELGVPDIVVNNAGIGTGGAFADTSPTDWQRAIDVNLWGVINGCRSFAPMMTEHGRAGRIVNTASAAAYLPSRAYPAYATTKAAVLMLSQCLRGELAEHGIRVTAVCPGLVHTGIIDNTTLAGTSAEQGSAARKRLNRLYQLRGYTPEKAARRITRAIRRGPALLPVTGEAHGGLALSRLTPHVLRAAARVSPPMD
ncbi:NADP-dependent 3-hydroxy acid dehydrogenase YdfG [Haloactinospora alba]|uniref:NADP-dependent 3-hydroxy acid dehydrogenase YdfG n=1 Tax=Haloactinospora alba TaxID=405555 RepID=A0A543NL84_9ACTN|nr:SDR family oxidoreductase [Haloactinospora alba]TQN32557.1 NADP-dependent 3-hydroxy acid dehydrogenase YdfG [Haloactinospora alba]